MSERISFTYEELKDLLHLMSEAREGLDEDTDDATLAVRDTLHRKVQRAWSKARRKRD